MSASNTTESAIMQLIFNGTAWANYADNAASSPQTNIAVGLHTADPGEAGTMSTNETTYTSYARVSVTRASAGWVESGGTVNPAATINFPQGGGTVVNAGTITHFSSGKTGGGAAAILISGTANPNVVVGQNVTPQLSTATAFTAD